VSCMMAGLPGASITALTPSVRPDSVDETRNSPAPARSRRAQL
jgi:hypothetical protein